MLDLLAKWDPLVGQANKVMMELLVRLGPLVLLAKTQLFLDLLAKLEPLAGLVLPELLVTQVLQVILGLQVLLVTQVLLELLEILGLLVFKVLQVLLETLVLLV